MSSATADKGYLFLLLIAGVLLMAFLRAPPRPVFTLLQPVETSCTDKMCVWRGVVVNVDCGFPECVYTVHFDAEHKPRNLKVSELRYDGYSKYHKVINTSSPDIHHPRRSWTLFSRS